MISRPECGGVHDLSPHPMDGKELNTIAGSDGPIAPSFLILLGIVYVIGIFHIRLPILNSPPPFFLRVQVNLCNRYPFSPSRLWRLIPVEVDTTKPIEDDMLEFVTAAPRKLESEPSLKTTADTVIDVEGLKLGGNGEMSITTTTTTVTTSVTNVKRMGIQ